MSQRYRLFWSPDSANLVIRMLLHELGQPFDAVLLDRSRQAHKQADYLALNPQGLIPVLVDHGQPVFETAAIALHLSDAHRALAPQASASAERARFLQWLFYLSNTVHADLRVLFYASDYTAGEAAQSTLRDGLRARLLGHWRLIEGELTGNTDGPWFLGDALSVLDLYLAALCRWWQLYPSDRPAAAIRAADFPCLHRLLRALAERPAIVAACAEEHLIAPLFVAPQPPDLPAAMITG